MEEVVMRSEKRVRKGACHSAYWYAKKYGWTHSEFDCYAGAYLDVCLSCSALFNPILFGIYIMVDIGIAMKRDVMKVVDPVQRVQLKEDLRRDLRLLRRPIYYGREARRRHELADERRRIRRRSTTAAMPDTETVLAAWKHRKDSKEAAIRLGGLLQDLECYVDNRLRIDENDRILGRNGGIRGWLRACLPELVPHYKSMMRYKAMAVKLRQATETEDPTPTETLLTEPHPAVVEEIFARPENTFAAIVDVLDRHLSPDRILDDAPCGQGKTLARTAPQNEKFPNSFSLFKRCGGRRRRR